MISGFINPVTKEKRMCLDNKTGILFENLVLIKFKYL